MKAPSHIQLPSTLTWYSTEWLLFMPKLWLKRVTILKLKLMFLQDSLRMYMEEPRLFTTIRQEVLSSWSTDSSWKVPKTSISDSNTIILETNVLLMEPSITKQLHLALSVQLSALTVLPKRFQWSMPSTIHWMPTPQSKLDLTIKVPSMLPYLPRLATSWLLLSQQEVTWAHSSQVELMMKPTQDLTLDSFSELQDVWDNLN